MLGNGWEEGKRDPAENTGGILHIFGNIPVAHGGWLSRKNLVSNGPRPGPGIGRLVPRICEKKGGEDVYVKENQGPHGVVFV